MLDMADFKIVAEISAAGSLTRAADTLFMSQPTLSKKLARLESQLSAKLFHRSSAGLRPTPIALFLLRNAQPIEARISSIERHVQRILEHDHGDLRIGVGPIIEQILLPQTLVAFESTTGNVRVSVLTDRADVLVEQLLNGSLDLIAGPFSAEDWNGNRDGVEAIDLIHERTINVARTDHPIFEPGGTDFFEHPYASPARQGTTQSANFPDEQLRKRLASDNYTLLKTIALSTNYICGGPREVFRKELEAGQLVEIPDTPSVTWQSACLFLTEARETPLVNLFVETLLDCRDTYVANHGQQRPGTI